MITWGSFDGHQNWFAGQPGWYQLKDRTTTGPDHDEPAGVPPSGSPAGPNPGPSPNAELRLVGRSLFATDLISPGWGWPVGARARQRRHLRLVRAREADRRRRALRTLLRPDNGRAVVQLRHRSRRTRLAAASSLAAVAALMGAVAWWQSEPPNAPTTVPTLTDAPEHRSATPTGSPATTTPARLTTPTSDAPPMASPPPSDDHWPDTVVPVAPPANPPTAGELASPTAAMVGWLSRWCPFAYTEPFGTAEAHGRPAMTDAGWAEFDPDHPQARRAWQLTVAAKEVGHCGQPTATVLTFGEGDGIAVVGGSVFRMVASPDRPPYIERLLQTRAVLRDADGRWRIDVATAGG